MNDFLNGDIIPRRTMVLFFLVDASTSMEGGKMGAVNDAIRNVLPMINEISNNNPDAEVKVAVLKFSSGCEWVYTEPKLASEFEWLDMEAAGLTDMGECFRELNSKLSRSSFLKSDGGYYAPAMILLSDGMPTDDYKSGLAKLQENKWYNAGIRLAIAIGKDADKNALAEFCKDKEGVFETNNIEQLKKVIRLVAIKSSQIGSKSTTTGDKSKQGAVIDEIKGAVDKEQQEDIASGKIDPAEPIKDNWEDWD